MCDTPHLLIANETYLDDVDFRTGQIIELERNGRPPLRPQLVHGEKILDVIAEKLLENHPRVVAGINGPLSSRDPHDASVVDLL